jgi:hypothetical protein
MASPSLPSYSSPFKGGASSTLPSPVPATTYAPIDLLEMPDAPPPYTGPAGGKSGGLSTGAKVGIGLGVGALLLYVMTRD